MKFVTQWIFRDLNEEVPRLAQNEVRDIETQGQSCRFFMETRLEDLRDTRKRLQEIGTSVYSIPGPFGKEWQILSASDPAAQPGGSEAMAPFCRA